MQDTTPTRRKRARDDRFCVWPDCNAPRRIIPEIPRDETPLCYRHLAKATAVHGIIFDADVQRMGLANKAAAQESAPKPEPASGVVYFLQSGGHVKIGWTSSLERRMRAYPPGSRLLAVHDGTRADEAAAHRKFAVHRTHGREWYPLAADLMRYIERVVEEHGEPPAVDFAGKPAEIPRPHSDRGTIKPKGWTRRSS